MAEKEPVSLDALNGLLKERQRYEEWLAALEDKLVQQAVVTVLNEIYEEDFLGFSYGFRPGRRPHDALDALWVALKWPSSNLISEEAVE